MKFEDLNIPTEGIGEDFVRALLETIEEYDETLRILVNR